jgi:hypothetical protein
MAHYQDLIEHEIDGIPCLIAVKSYYKQDADSKADSDWDYYGYSEWDGDILDEDGEKADWICEKITSQEQDKIDSKVDKFYA